MIILSDKKQSSTLSSGSIFFETYSRLNETSILVFAELATLNSIKSEWA